MWASEGDSGVLAFSLPSVSDQRPGSRQVGPLFSSRRIAGHLKGGACQSGQVLTSPSASPAAQLRRAGTGKGPGTQTPSPGGSHLRAYRPHPAAARPPPSCRSQGGGQVQSAPRWGQEAQGQHGRCWCLLGGPESLSQSCDRASGAQHWFVRQRALGKPSKWGLKTV